MTTIREWLTAADFDFENGKIIVQWDGDEETRYAPGWDTPNCATDNVEEITKIIDTKFDCGYGGPECPRFIAEDGEKIYFPSQYDGATGLECVYKDIRKYLDVKNETPYPGG